MNPGTDEGQLGDSLFQTRRGLIDNAELQVFLESLGFPGVIPESGLQIVEKMQLQGNYTKILERRIVEEYESFRVKGTQFPSGSIGDTGLGVLHSFETHRTMGQSRGRCDNE